MKVSNGSALLLTGIAIGLIAGVLIAPEEGAETRKKLWKKSKKFKKDFEDTAAEYKEKATNLKEKIVNAAQDVKKNFS
jgi:gas vesicle protein